MATSIEQNNRFGFGGPDGVQRLLQTRDINSGDARYGTQLLLREQENSPALDEGKELFTRLVDIGILRANVSFGGSGISHQGSKLTTFVQLGDQMVHGKYMISGKDGNYRKNKVEDIQLLQERQKIVVVSGPCLFSGSSIQAIDTAGETHYINYPPHLDAITAPISEIAFDSRLQPYEVDAILRFEDMIGYVNTAKHVTVALNVPRVEYYCYLLHLYEKGLVEELTLLRYFDIVDERARRIESLMAKRIPPGVNIARVNPLDEIENITREGVRMHAPEIFPSVLAVLSQHNIYRQAIKRSKPQSFKDLCQLSYALAHLKLANDKDTTLVVMENPEEMATFHEAANLLPGIVSGAQVIGLYAHPKVVLSSESDSVIGKQYLYFYKGRGRRDVEDVIRANREN